MFWLGSARRPCPAFTSPAPPRPASPTPPPSPPPRPRKRRRRPLQPHRRLQRPRGPGSHLGYRTVQVPAPLGTAAHAVQVRSAGLGLGLGLGLGWTGSLLGARICAALGWDPPAHAVHVRREGWAGGRAGERSVAVAARVWLCTRPPRASHPRPAWTSLPSPPAPTSRAAAPTGLPQRPARAPASAPCSAMARLDPATGRPRGFMRMGRHPRLDSVLFTLDVRDAHWQQANRRGAPGRCCRRDRAACCRRGRAVRCCLAASLPAGPWHVAACRLAGLPSPVLPHCLLPAPPQPPPHCPPFPLPPPKAPPAPSPPLQLPA